MILIKYLTVWLSRSLHRKVENKEVWISSTKSLFIRKKGVVMTTNKNEIKVSIVAGPNEMQLMMSLMRAYKGPYGIDISKATSVYFTTDGKESTMTGGFSACVNGMSRENGSGNSWMLEGYLFDYPNISGLNGYYNSKTRKGYLTLTLR